MKVFVLSSVLSFVFSSVFFSSTAFAKPGDPFEITQDGINYSCVATSSVSTDAVFKCADKAYAGPYTRDEATALCAKARNTAPADCAIAAYAGPFTKTQAAQLCTGAATTGPADCAKAAYSGPFNKDEAIALCSQYGTKANADCAAKAYAGPYSKSQAIALCR